MSPLGSTVADGVRVPATRDDARAGLGAAMASDGAGVRAASGCVHPGAGQWPSSGDAPPASGMRAYRRPIALAHAHDYIRVASIMQVEHHDPGAPA